ncbi:MAG TPA: class IV adenylate cyclase [Ferruginibacter sp.]|nr:class IV adenylate cyclase [Ferruginibacter sp.]
MNVRNFEFKAKVDSLKPYESKLLGLNPEFKGLDHQIDTYFNVPHGRLKLREGNIEHALINYDRENVAGSKESTVILYVHEPDSALKEILVRQLGVKVIVDKQRKIYYIENVKIHLDTVKDLGHFLEVEAIDRFGVKSIEELIRQCNYFCDYFELTDQNMVDKSYSDLILEKRT